MNSDLLGEILSQQKEDKTHAVVLDDAHLSYYNNIEEAEIDAVKLREQGHEDVVVRSVDSLVEELS